MASVLVGLFNPQTDKEKLENDLMQSGFSDQDFIVFLDPKSPDASYMTSVKIENSSKVTSVQDVFKKNQVLKDYHFENLDWKDADYKTLKAKIEIRAKAQIPNFGSLNTKEGSEGIDDEVIS